MTEARNLLLLPLPPDPLRLGHARYLLCQLEDHNLKMCLFCGLVRELALEPFGFVGEARNLLLAPALERLSQVPEAPQLRALPNNLRLKTGCYLIAVTGV